MNEECRKLLQEYAWEVYKLTKENGALLEAINGSEFYKDGTSLRWREVDFEKHCMGQFTKKQYLRYFCTMNALNDAAVYDYENC